MRFTFLPPALVLLAALPAPAAPGKLTDPQAAALAREALASKDPGVRQEAIRRLERHFFKELHSKDREFTVYALGTLLEREGETARAVGQFRKLERSWPQSVYLPEAQVLLGEFAVTKGRLREGEQRLRRSLNADIPVETKRRAQEQLLWTLVEQKRAPEGLQIVQGLFPAGEAKPSERGLVAIAEVLATAAQKDEVEATLKSLRLHYPESQYLPRVELVQGRMLGDAGDTQAAADAFQKLIRGAPRSPEADEARLALAAILSEGKLPPKAAGAYPAPDALLGEVTRRSSNAVRALVVQLRIAINNSKWVEALAIVAKIRAEHPSPAEAMTASELRSQAFKAWAQGSLERRQPGELLGSLDAEGIQCLNAPQRRLLVAQLAEKGLPQAAATVIDLAPAAEREDLRQALLASTLPEAHPREVLGLLKGRRESPQDALRRAKSLLALQAWDQLPGPLARANPGPERMALLLAYLRRPRTPGDLPARRREAEGWLSRSREKAEERESLVLLVADLRAQAGDWRGALALYPAAPRPENRGWVALMRATCLLKLAQRDQAREVLKAAQAESGFKLERQTLGRELGM